MLKLGAFYEAARLYQVSRLRGFRLSTRGMGAARDARGWIPEWLIGDRLRRVRPSFYTRARGDRT